MTSQRTQFEQVCEFPTEPLPSSTDRKLLPEVKTPTLAQRQHFQRRPDQRAVMTQSWEKLLFLHWRYPAELIQQHLPRGLMVDCFENSAWVGVVPFFMRNIRPVWFPSVPYVSNFLEMNVRTYVYDAEGRPGVWFFSLAANRGLAVLLARMLFHLPYYWSQMSAQTQQDGTVHYNCRRFDDPERVTQQLTYRPTGVAQPAVPGTLEFFLVERYLLFSQHRQSLFSGQVHHVPYQIQPVEYEQQCEQSLLLAGLPHPQRPPEHACYAPGVDVEVYGLQPLRPELSY